MKGFGMTWSRLGTLLLLGLALLPAPALADPGNWDGPGGGLAIACILGTALALVLLPLALGGSLAIKALLYGVPALVAIAFLRSLVAARGEEAVPERPKKGVDSGGQERAGETFFDTAPGRLLILFSFGAWLAALTG